MHGTNNSREAARRLDREDELRGFRGEFTIPRHSDGSELLYFCGNSLGLPAKNIDTEIEAQLQAWRELAVEGHFFGKRPWISYHECLREPLAALTGADPLEIVAMNTLTVNLHLMMVSFYRPNGRRRKILIEQQAFPSDRYAVESQIRFHGLDPADCLVELGPADGSSMIEESQVEDFLGAEGDQVALVLWPGVQYASGQVFDLPRIAAAGRAAGARVGFDLAHSVGNVVLDLHDTHCDFAVWCTYKYLNAGPGAIAGCFINGRHHGRNDLPRFHGWWGNEKESRFEMGPHFQPAPGADAWQLSNQPILSLAPLRTSLDTFQRAGMQRLRDKSKAMTNYLACLIESDLGHILEVVTPSAPERRGCQLSLRVRAGRAEGHALFDYLVANGVLPDWREPDFIRAAPVPLYNRFEDCFGFVEKIKTWVELQGVA